MWTYVDVDSVQIQSSIHIYIGSQQVLHLSTPVHTTLPHSTTFSSYTAHLVCFTSHKGLCYIPKVTRFL